MLDKISFHKHLKLKLKGFKVTGVSAHIIDGFQSITLTDYDLRIKNFLGSLNSQLQHIAQNIACIVRL